MEADDADRPESSAEGASEGYKGTAARGGDLNCAGSEVEARSTVVRERQESKAPARARWLL